MLDNLQEYFETPIEIVFSKKRKTISIQVKPDSIRVLSTYWISKNSVREFILKNESWIRKKLADQKLRVKPVTYLVNNEKFDFVINTLGPNQKLRPGENKNYFCLGAICAIYELKIHHLNQFQIFFYFSHRNFYLDHLQNLTNDFLNNLN